MNEFSSYCHHKWRKKTRKLFFTKIKSNATKGYCVVVLLNWCLCYCATDSLLLLCSNGNSPLVLSRRASCWPPVVAETVGILQRLIPGVWGRGWEENDPRDYWRGRGQKITPPSNGDGAIPSCHLMGGVGTPRYSLHLVVIKTFSKIENFVWK